MATITLADAYSNLDSWPGDLLAATDGVTIGTHTATNFTYTFNAGTQWAGYSVIATGSGFTYDGAEPLDGTLKGLKITDDLGQTVLQITGISAASYASDMGLFAAYQFGWTDPGGGGADSQLKNAWSLLFSGNDVVIGTSGDDGRGFVGVDAGNDLFNMGAGDDWVNGGLGNDTINGGDGWDVLDYGETTWNEGIPMVRGVTIDVTAGTVKDPYGFVDTFTDIEEFHGSATRDRFIGGAQGKDFMGLRGADVFIGGTSGNDWIVYHDDTWSGGGRGIVANLGVKTVNGKILGTVQDGFGNIDKTTNIDNVSGTRYGDRLTGNSHDNVFAGGEGKDSYRGGAGSDWVIFSWSFTDLNPHGISVDLRKTTGQILDDGFGNKENAISIENIRGGFQDDVIIGNAGNNLIRGDEGNDTMTGAGGADEFNWSFVQENGGAELITDFQSEAGADQDILSFGFSNEGLSTVLTLVIGTAATTAGVGTFVFNATTHMLSFDLDGAGGNDMVNIVTLAGVTTLTAANFDLY